MSNDLRSFKMLKMEVRTLMWWRSRRDRIDVEPSYQRKGRRWSVSDKQYLIDSILNGFDIPKFYMADFTWADSILNEKKLEFAVIDGKQRFEAIFDFFDGKFALAKEIKLIRHLNFKVGGLKYAELKMEFPDVAEIFDNYNLDVMSVITSKKEFVEELFVRLNRSKPLSGAEIRNAITGEISSIIREIRDCDFFSANVRFNSSRGQDLNCAAKLFIFEVTGEVQETKKASLDRFVREQSFPPERIQRSIEMVFRTLEHMSEIFQFKDVLLQSEGQIPVYYWLCRHSEPENITYIRDFLDKFQAEISAAPKRVSLLSANDRDEYKAASRSVNDKSSHAARFALLHKAFLKWLKTNV
ncbi:MAG: DUF262 domain-containing protein [Bdellovibrionales bacterium]|nr:DUF262 domain-containing protein [Massilia sp.]